MTPVYLKKKQDEGNTLGWDEIFLLDRKLYKSYSEDKKTFYEYEFLALCDGSMCIIGPEEFESLEECYESKVLITS